ncbi:uncharacterized protein An11g08090 [Aspergillus niger]|uniref:Contig An11c0270, genomic contig n=2 Tax=Aspergillus niger TaxID=5061 RepID=A2QX94_ASPNC|nr:uncharacterized protein An11g08090 [Aspergillus niger]CAK46002.1 unnamed protein product [Aspergillus niger]
MVRDLRGPSGPLSPDNARAIASTHTEDGFPSPCARVSQHATLQNHQFYNNLDWADRLWSTVSTIYKAWEGKVWLPSETPSGSGTARKDAHSRDTTPPHGTCTYKILSIKHGKVEQQDALLADAAAVGRLLLKPLDRGGGE